MNSAKINRNQFYHLYQKQVFIAIVKVIFPMLEIVCFCPNPRVA